MKHTGKDWYTCDRCGKDFNLLPRDVLGRIFTYRKNKPLIACMNTVDLSGYVSKTELLGEAVLSAEIVEFYKNNDKPIHLCGDCQKAFEEFMEGGNGR